jgi:aminoglycoside 6-adenylyltransferase
VQRSPPIRAESALLDRIVRWAESEDRVRAALLTGSRANGAARVDALSDYDVALLVEDPDALRCDLGWLEDIGTVVVRQVPEPPPWADAMQTVLVFFAGGLAGATKVDFALMPISEIERHVRAGTLPDNLDVGWQLLLDKDGVAEGLAAPTHFAHRVRKPSAAAFAWLAESFFFEATYVAKNLWRDEVWPAKHSLETVMKQEMLRRMLEWLVASGREWDYRPDKLGRGLEPDLPARL